MIEKLQSKHQNLQQKFNIAWVILTLVFLSMVLFFQWTHLATVKNREYASSANSLAYKIDEFIENLLETLHTLPLTDEEFDSCKISLRTKLQSMVFNNPTMSGIVVSDATNKVICTSIKIIPALPIVNRDSPVLYGPFKFNSTVQPVFLLQERISKYYLGIYILESILTAQLKKDGASFTFIGLYDKQQKKMLLQISNPTESKPSSLTNNQTTPLQEISDFIIPLQNLDNVSLLINVPTPIYAKEILAQMLLTCIPLLIFSWVLYAYCLSLLRKRFSLRYAINNALKTGQFFPVYQAIWDQSTKRFCGAEVLIRWALRKDEIILPDAFIGVAEKSGLIVPMTLQLIEKTFQECKNLLHEQTFFHLAFNLGPIHFKDKHFFSEFFKLCAEYEIPASSIMLELTERELFNQDDAKVVRRMRELRESGFDLAIDDFGTGQSNINYLQQFPFNYLKIDKIFISSIGTGAINETLNNSIIKMAQTLHLHIIAEGVETQQQSDYLYKNSVNFIQGWFYAKAMSYQEFASLISSTNKDLS